MLSEEKEMKMKTLLFLAIAAILLTSASVQAYGNASDVEAITGGTFLNFGTVADVRNSITMAPVVLGAAVPDARTTSTMVNWSVPDTSDGTRLVGGNGIEDNNRRSGLSTVDGRTPITPVLGTVFNPFSVVISGLVANATYTLKVVAIGEYEDSSNPIPGYLDYWQPDIGIGNMDFSYGATAGTMTTVANAAAGAELYSEVSTYTNTRDTNPNKPVGYKYWKGAFANSIGSWTADGSGSITVFIGDGAKNDVLSGARTQLDGIVVVPEPATLAILSLGGLALLRKRK
jgi:hypothetical protein